MMVTPGGRVVRTPPLSPSISSRTAWSSNETVFSSNPNSLAISEAVSGLNDRLIVAMTPRAIKRLSTSLAFTLIFSARSLTVVPSEMVSGRTSVGIGGGGGAGFGAGAGGGRGAGAGPWGGGPEGRGGGGGGEPGGGPPLCGRGGEVRGITLPGAGREGRGGALGAGAGSGKAGLSTRPLRGEAGAA